MKHNIVADARLAFGLARKDKLPAEGVGPIVGSKLCGGFRVWIRPLRPRAEYETMMRATGFRPDSRRMGHRMVAQCLTCELIMSAGRTHQHKCKGRKAE